MSGKCGVCGGLESFTQPFVECSSCHKKRDHAHCVKVDLRALPKDWKCKKCLKKDTHSSDPSLTVPSTSRPGPPSMLPSVPGSKMGRICKDPGCMKPIFQSDSTLCQTHKIEQRHKKAAAAAKPATALPGSRSKGIKKKKLYNFKRSDMKHLKRKRSSGEKKNSSYSESAVPLATSSKVISPQARSPSQERNTATKLPTQITPMRTSQQRAAQLKILAGKGGTWSPIDANPNSPDGSPSMAESPASVMNTELDGDLSRHTPHSAGRTPQTTHPTTSPEYSPPPPIELQRTNATTSPEYSPPPPADMSSTEPNKLRTDPNSERDDSPGSQIHQEMRATVEQPDGEIPGVAESLAHHLASLIADCDQAEKPGPANNTADADENINKAHEEEDQAMPDVPLLPESDLETPATTSKSSSPTPSDEAVHEEGADAEILSPDMLESVEAKRKQLAATFDPSELDSYLLEQAEPQSEMQPTSQELVETQIWGHINPAVVWPKEISGEWLAAKRLEIDARGGRKANYGKLLTAQIRKERMENGWNIHQDSEMRSDKKWAESARHMEELFGMKNIDELIPGQRNGQLVMMEPPKDEIGKRRKKPKVYPVH